MSQTLRRLRCFIVNDSLLMPSQNRIAFNLSPSADRTGSPKISEGKSTSWKTSKGAGSAYYFFMLFLIFFIPTAAHSRASVVQQVQNRIAYINGESLNDRHPVQCIGLVIENDKLLIVSNCTKENTISENTPVINLKNSTIGYFSSTGRLESNSYFKEDYPELSENEKFYIYTGNPIEIWMPVRVSKLNEDTFNFSSITNEQPLIKMGAPVINDRGEIICLNNGNNYCEPPSRSAEFSISFQNRYCLVSRIPNCIDPTWQVCNTKTQEGIGQCFRWYDTALCSVTLNGHASGVRGTTSCIECKGDLCIACHTDWLDSNNQIIQQTQTPKECMSYYVSDSRWSKSTGFISGIVLASACTFVAALNLIIYLGALCRHGCSYEAI